jgi:DNA (cytosine-5)-methyltransferase 1
LSQYRVVEICAGAAGQSAGLELAGFEHDLSVELDPNAAATLRHSGRIGRPPWGRSQSPACLRPVIVRCVDLLAGGLPYPSFTIAGNKLGATYERDLFAWAIELGGIVQPRALMLENVRGLSLLRFAAYHQHARDLLWTRPAVFSNVQSR